MSVPSDSLRIDAYRWRDELRKIYAAAPGPVGASVVVSILREQVIEMEDLYDKFIRIPTVTGGRSETEQADIARQFRTFRGELETLSERLKGYTEDADDPPEGVEQPEFSDRWVAGPLFRGVWPDDYYLYLQPTTPDRPEVAHVAALWNQIVSVQEVWETIGDPLDRLIVNWLEESSRQMSSSAPGEDPTAADAVLDAVDHLRHKAADLAEGSLVWLGITLGVGLAIWAVSKAR